MRYILARNDNNELMATIWAKSQFRDAKGRECSHRDYLRNNNIPFDKTLGIGDIHMNVKTGEKIVCPLPWDGPEAPNEEAKSFLKIKANEYLKTYAKELAEEIQSDWNNYQVYMERQKQFLANQGK